MRWSKVGCEYVQNTTTGCGVKFDSACEEIFFSPDINGALSPNDPANASA
jgi:hypothetical protein